ncbi:unnamed protein product [Durusdinium trenchii]|uniref:Uncharacterized protein n=1 Tax=Durusdinium trenchii TaxID=1381693 RepID=A0ABP0SMN0_9DINO
MQLLQNWFQGHGLRIRAESFERGLPVDACGAHQKLLAVFIAFLLVANDVSIRDAVAVQPCECGFAGLPDGRGCLVHKSSDVASLHPEAAAVRSFNHVWKKPALLL